MNKLTIYYFDTNGFGIDELINASFIREEDKKELSKYRSKETKKEKVLSTHFKNKYIGEYYLNEYGKPLSNNIWFNIAHSKGMVIFAKGESSIGIDIERIRPYHNELKDYISSEEENRYIVEETNFYEIWTSKESLTKADGRGINKSIKLIPGLPINGKVTYEEKVYNRESFTFLGYVISISSECPYEVIEIIEEKLHHA